MESLLFLNLSSLGKLSGSSSDSSPLLVLKGRRKEKKTILTWDGDVRGAFNATDVGKLYSACKMGSDAFQKGVVESILWNYRYPLISIRCPLGRMWQRMWQVLETDLVFLLPVLPLSSCANLLVR